MYFISYSEVSETFSNQNLPKMIAKELINKESNKSILFHNFENKGVLKKEEIRPPNKFFASCTGRIEKLKEDINYLENMFKLEKDSMKLAHEYGAMIKTSMENNKTDIDALKSKLNTFEKEIRAVTSTLAMENQELVEKKNTLEGRVFSMSEKAQELEARVLVLEDSVENKDALQINRQNDNRIQQQLMQTNMMSTGI